MLPQQIQGLAARLLKKAMIAGWLLVPAATAAAVVEIRTPDKIVATAEFWQGKAGKPAILVLHGFLQTRDFGIVKSVSETLADEGYSVLSPTLSLGISHRKRSLDCEALHLHDMETDIREIQQWMQWLRSRGYTKMVGVGHSFGATQLLAWRERQRETNTELIGISMLGSEPFNPESASLPGKRTPQEQPGTGLVHAPISFCDTYTAPARQFASYAQWNENRILAALRQGGGRTDVILGSADKFTPLHWKARLAKAGVQVHEIRDANYFMDGTQEFDMLDTILGILKR